MLQCSKIVEGACVRVEQSARLERLNSILMGQVSITGGCQSRWLSRICTAASTRVLALSLLGGATLLALQAPLQPDSWLSTLAYALGSQAV